MKWKELLNFQITSGDVDPDFVWTEEVEQMFADAMAIVHELRDNDEDETL